MQKDLKWYSLAEWHYEEVKTIYPWSAWRTGNWARWTFDLTLHKQYCLLDSLLGSDYTNRMYMGSSNIFLWTAFNLTSGTRHAGKYPQPFTQPPAFSDRPEVLEKIEHHFFGHQCLWVKPPATTGLPCLWVWFLVKSKQMQEEVPVHKAIIYMALANETRANMLYEQLS